MSEGPTTTLQEPTRPADPVLELRGISKRFGSFEALNAADFTCLAGEVHALMGENGAGKSTMMRIVGGLMKPSAGTISVDGREVLIDSPVDAAALGIAMVHQDTRLVPDLSVARNIWLGREPGGPFGLDIAAMAADAAALIAQLGMEIDPARPVHSLSVAERQVVEIARALTIEPRVLILDEPTSALDGAEIANLFAIVDRLRQRGTAVIFISHRIPEVFSVADRMTVLKDGSIVGTVTREEVTHDGLVSMMVGRSVEFAYPPRGESDGEVRLSVAGLSSGSLLTDVNFEVRAGEIVGLGGIQGNGQSDVARALFGALPAQGRITIDGQPYAPLNPARAIRNGLIYIPGDRHTEGLFMVHSVRENTSLPHLRDWFGLGVISRSRENAVTADAMARFATKAESAEAPVSSMSGGNQQKVVLGRWTASNPKVYIFEDPTRGVDVGAKLEIYRQIRALADAGAAVVLVASDLMELIGLSDRILVFSRGSIVDEMRGEDGTEERIVGAAAGVGEQTEGPVSTTESRPVIKASTGGLFWSRYAGAVLLAALIVVLFGVTSYVSPFFFTPANLSNIATQIAPLALVALGQFVVLLVRGIDLSVGPVLSLVTAIVSYMAVAESGLDTTTTILVCLAVGLVVGLVNAALTVWLRIPDLIATLATYSLFYGVVLIVRPAPGGLVSLNFIDTVGAQFGWVPAAAVVAVVLYIIAEVCLIRGRIGQRLYATGSAPEAAAAIGIRPALVRSAAYMFCGLMAAAAGLVLAARIGSGDPQAGSAYTLSSITAVVIGGTSVFGGRGTAVATLLGAIAVGVMQNALNLMHVSAYWQYVWTGLLTLLAVSAYSMRLPRQAGSA